LTGNIDPVLVEQAAADLKTGGSAARHWLPRKGIEKDAKVKALLAVDVFGQPAELDTLERITQNYELKLIEDSCEALGAEYKGKKAGTFGFGGVFAFYPNKQITTGEGGVIITNDEAAAALMRALRNQGRAPGDTWLSHTYLGYNYRLDEMSAALGAAQMQRFEDLSRKRQQVADWYAERLAEIPGVEIPAITPATTRMSWFVYVIRLRKGLDRTIIAARLAERGIPVRPYFLPIHLQPYMVERFGYRKGDFPVTEDLGERGLAVPFSGVMSEAQVELVCSELRSTIGG
jgi:dTDP-4-amino-4,6-dideoxygalactose transaminase